MDKNKKTNKIVTWLWVTFSIGIILVFVLFFMVYNGMIGYMPRVAARKTPADKFATVVYSAAGEELGRYVR
ncbi:MAG: hypothetical protein K2G74_06560, partial [Muribaculaceae bacterium]|nr:hypothetical protein [Muribaculaceae bacterium]